MKPKFHVILLFVFLLLITSGCSASSEVIAQAVQETVGAWTEVPSPTLLPTYTKEPTVAIEVTRLIVVTVTSTLTPPFTSTPSLTPTATGTPTRTPTPSRTPTSTRAPNLTQTQEAQSLAILRRPLGNGTYYVGTTIAPGTWKSGSNRENCYWEKFDARGNIISNFFGNSAAGQTIYIPPSTYGVEFNGCGTWTFISPP